jgi:hypothetical protein
LRALIAAGIFLLAIGFALRQFRARELTSFGELVTNAFTGAVSVRDLSRTLRIISKSNAGVQYGRGNQNKSDYLHLIPQQFLQL